MERNDLAPFTSIRQGTMFEGVLASPPTGIKLMKARLAERSGDWTKVLSLWAPHTVPLKSLADSVHRLGIDTDVYTFLPQEAVDAIDKWLIRKGLSVSVVAYPSVAELAYDLTFDRSVRVVYTSSRDDALVLGMRATVVGPATAWSI